MFVLVAAIGSALAALLELTLAPYIDVGGAHPHLVLLVAVIVTAAFGFDGGLAVAVAGGLVLDILAPRPLGATVFVLLLVVGGVAASARVLAGLRILAPILLVAAASPAFSLGLAVVIAVAQGRAWVDDPVGLVLPGAVYDTVLAAVAGPLLVSLRARALEADRFEW
jgi:rod shape-determining protein MreD